ncbi:MULTISPECIES: hypothetical protein [unclassified Nostoc]|uniref:hypothetical protein n=1 Tax=unclassified Nostoc TaxID=2593658 RepID=UPI0013D65FC0|nr:MULTISPECIES: hypothetical protein [unclassified Nostoc]MBE9000753.1 hypothetical protein [Nostoc sp. LEGE 12447]NEU84596.1 hypothetical protein [Nostoc sp. UIC 10630]
MAQKVIVLKEQSIAKLRAFRRHPRGPKIAQPKRTYIKNKPHVSTAKTLGQKTQNINTP